MATKAKSGSLLKKVMENRTVCSKSWYDRLSADQRRDVDSILRRFYAGKLPHNVTMFSICRAIRDEYKIETSVDTMARYLREKSK